MNPFRIILGWYHRLNMREQVAAQAVGALIIVGGMIATAFINGWFTLSAPGGDVSSQTTEKPEAARSTTQGSQVQNGSGNVKAGRNIVVQGDLVLGGKDGSARKESQSFVSLAEPLRQGVKSNLLAVQQAHAGDSVGIEIASQVGNLERMKLADELAGVFKSAGFNVKVLSSSILTQDRAPIQFIIHPDGRAYATAIWRALGPMLRVRVPPSLSGRDSRPRNELHISLLGDPVFLPNGVAVFN